MPHTHGVIQFAFSPNRSDEVAWADVRMILGVHRGDVPIWEQLVATELDKVRPTERIRGLAFTPDGGQLVALVADHVRCYASATGELLWESLLPRQFGFLVTSPGQVAIRANGEIVVAADDGSLVRFSPEGDILKRHRMYDLPVRMHINETENVLAFAEGFAIGRFDLRTGKDLSRTHLPHRIYAASFNRQGDRVAVRTLRAVEIWDVFDVQKLHEIIVEPSPPLVGIHPTEDLVVISDGANVRFMTTRGTLIKENFVDGPAIVSLFMHPNGDSVWLGLSDGSIRSLPTPIAATASGRV